MKLIKLCTLHFALSTLAASAAIIQPLSLPPFTFAGRITDYAHIAYDADSMVEIRVKASDGTLLAKTHTSAHESSSFNYRIDIPIASQSIPGYGKIGETVAFEFIDPEGRSYSGLVTDGDATLGLAGDYRKLDIILATDANKDGVADEYVETLEYLMWINGIAEYDPNADYDKDGATNYAEYVAGTNPFDATDRFNVRQMAMAVGEDDYIAMRVMVNQGRVYSVKTTEELGAADWKEASFSVQDPSEALRTRLATGPTETGYRTIYVKKGSDASRFWKLEVE